MDRPKLQHDVDRPTRPAPHRSAPRDRVSAPRKRSRARAAFFAVGLLLIPLAAVWFVPAFVTQDGPAHVYSGRVMLELVRNEASTPYSRVYEARWQPVPNWAAHAVLMGLLTVMSPDTAGRVMATVTLVGVAASTLWLRRKVTGAPATAFSSVAAALLAVNFLWLMGFWSFLLGVIVSLVTLGVAWGWGSDRVPRSVWARRAFVLGAFLVLGYFCHPVSLGVTVLGLLAFALGAGVVSRRLRLVWTLAAFVPLAPLGAWYAGTVSRSGPVQPRWENFREPHSPSGWIGQLGWADPLTLGSRAALPWMHDRWPPWVLASPVFLLLMAGYLGVASGTIDRPETPVVFEVFRPSQARARREERPRGVWVVLSVGLIVLGAFAPDTLGEAHGNYLPQRLVLVGLLLGVAVIEPGSTTRSARRCARAATAVVAAAFALQAMWLWDYASFSNSTAGRLVRGAAPHITAGERVACLTIDNVSRFRANPLMHAGTLLGVERDAIVWNNYETAHYYFPLRVRSEVPHPPAEVFEAIATRRVPGVANAWRGLLSRHHAEIDILVTRGAHASIDTASERWFEVQFEDVGAGLRVWRRKEATSAAPGAGEVVMNDKI